MGTKLKKYSRLFIFKLIAFILSAICVFVAFAATIDATDNVDTIEPLMTDYINSFYFRNTFSADISNVITGIKYYKSEQNILLGNLVRESDIDSALQNIYYSQYVDEMGGNSYNSAKRELLAKYPELEVTAKSLIIESQLEQYNQLKEQLSSSDGLVFYATNGQNELKKGAYKTIDYYKTLAACYCYDKGEYTITSPNNDNYFQPYGIYDTTDLEKTDTVFIGYTDDYMSNATSRWNNQRQYLIVYILIMAASLLLFILSTVYLIVTAGKKCCDEIIHYNWFDKIYGDIMLAAVCLITIAMAYATEEVALYSGYTFKYYYAITLVTLTFMLCYALLLSYVKRIKTRTIFTHTLIYKIISTIVKAVKKVLAGGKIVKHYVTFFILYSIAVMIMSFIFWPISIVLIVLGGIYIYHFASDFLNIKVGLTRAKNGDMRGNITVKSHSHLGKMADDINSLSDGLKKAVDNELKSERLKSELISNVSHDIKTPLTSIINYVDLLKKEGKNSENFDHYIEVLDSKSQILKVLTEDLFEAAKASSGAIPVNLETVNVNQLIKQGLGELDDKIQQSGLEFKLSEENKNVLVTADGKLLWRVFENLLSNIFKYAMKNTRVYIDITEQGNKAIITIKNVSAYELNIEANELMERFKRGDESRNSEGSGLGLSIANSLMNLQGGKFSIEIDGDLFKTTIEISKESD